MKRIVLFISGCVLILIVALSVMLNFNSKKEKTVKVKVAEVAHTIFYTPQYVAIEKGFFKEEGLDVELILTPGADKVTAAVLSKDANIGLSGSEATIYVYNGGEKNYLKTFAQLTQKDGSFIVSRKKEKNFTLDNLKGKTIIGGRAGGMPEMTLEWVLKENGIDPQKDVNIDTSVTFAAMGSAFMGGTGDYVSLFEPTALEVEKQGYGYVVASLGNLGGNVPYTSYSAQKSYIKDNKEVIEKFEKVIQKSLDYVHKTNSKKIAKDIQDQFPDTSLKDLAEVIDRYKKINAWPKTTDFKKESWNHLQDIMISANQLNKKVPYKTLIYEK